MERTLRVSTSAPELPVICVLVLNYNGLRHLEPCFSSLQQLEYPADKLELVLVDNNSSDGSVEFMRTRFPGVKIVHHPQNYGFSKGNNLGAEQARGQLVAFLNNDMRVDRRWLIELAQPLLRDPDIICAGSKILSWNGKYIDFAGSAANVLGHGFQEGWGEPPEAFGEEKLILAPCGGAMLMDRQVFIDCGGFDEDYFAFYEDLDLGWRLWVLGYKVAYAPRAITYHVHHGWWGKAPNAKVSVLYQRNAFCTLFKNYDDENLSRILPVALMLYLRRAYLAADVNVAAWRSEPAEVAPHLHAESPHAKPPVYGGAYYLREVWRTLRGEGIGGLCRKVAAEIGRRRRVLLSRRPPAPSRHARQAARPGYVFADRRAASHLVAADDIVCGLDHLMEKRQAVQSRRRRSDKEILSMLRKPFLRDDPNPHYIQTMEELVAACGLRNLFEPE